MALTRKKLVHFLNILLKINNIEIIKCAIESLLDDLDEQDDEEQFNKER